MENMLSLGLAIAGATLGAAVVLDIAFGLMGADIGDKRYEPPTITLRLGVVLFAVLAVAMGLFFACTISIVSIISAR
jgi:hypothetical protein